MNEHEERARATKAFRLSRVIVRAIRNDETGLLTIESMRDVDDSFRRRIAALAETNPPSPTTWTMAVDLAAETLGD